LSVELRAKSCTCLLVIHQGAALMSDFMSYLMTSVTCVHCCSDCNPSPGIRIKKVVIHWISFFPPLKKNCKEAPVPGGGCASKTWSFSSACKNLGAQHPLGVKTWFSKKGTLGGYNSTSTSPRLLDQTSPDLFQPNAGRIAVDKIFV